jgi:hypothetical protein
VKLGERELAEGGPKRTVRAAPVIGSTRRAVGPAAPVAVQAKFLHSLQSTAGNRATAELVKSWRRPASEKTALPRHLRNGIESLSGISLDGVRVRYGSAQAARMGASAYTKGDEIHVAPGQERHLAHEAWHVVQQAQGRVQPTKRLTRGPALNDDAGLEAEADAMGTNAQARGRSAGARRMGPEAIPALAGAGVVQRVKGLEKYANVTVARRGKGIILEVLDGDRYQVQLADDSKVIVGEDQVEPDLEASEQGLDDDEGHQEGGGHSDDKSGNDSEEDSPRGPRTKLAEKVKGSKPGDLVTITKVLLRGSTTANEHQELLLYYGNGSGRDSNYLRISRNNAEDTLQWGADNRDMALIEEWKDQAIPATLIEEAFRETRDMLPYYESGDCQAFAGVILDKLKVTDKYAPGGL